jgi:hypothetical protein
VLPDEDIPKGFPIDRFTRSVHTRKIKNRHIGALLGEMIRESLAWLLDKLLVEPLA